MLSIVIPAYNRTEKLYTALESLTTQIMKDFITIVVDDASVEDLQEVCNKFKDKLKLVYIRQDINGGPGAARQAGINWSAINNIEYIMFLDSDDILFPNATYVLQYEISHSNHDFISSNIAIEHIDGPQTIKLAQDGVTWTHGKIYRVEYLVSNKIKFPATLRTNEDLMFNLCVVWSTEHSAFVNAPVYLWRDDRNSITRAEGEPRNNALGIDYIRAVYLAFKFILPNKNFQMKYALPNIMMCYNYYQLMKERGEEISSEVDDKIKEMLTYPRVVEELKNGKNWVECQKYIKHYQVNSTCIYKFHESFGDWYDRLTTPVTNEQLSFDFSLNL